MSSSEPYIPDYMYAKYKQDVYQIYNKYLRNIKQIHSEYIFQLYTKPTPYIYEIYTNNKINNTKQLQTFIKYSKHIPNTYQTYITTIYQTHNNYIQTYIK